MDKETTEIIDDAVKDAPVIDEKINTEIKDKETTNSLEVEKKDEENLDISKSNEFDPSVFADKPLVDAEIKDKVVEKEDEAIVDGKAGDDSLEFKPYEEEEEVKLEKEKTEENIPIDKEQEIEAPKIADAFQQVANELGLKFETIDEMKEHLVALEEENTSLRNNTQSGSTNDAVTKLESLKGKTDEELVRLSLEKEGFEGEKLNSAVDKYIDNDMLDIEAQKIRNTIDRAIGSEKNKITQSTAEADAMQQKEEEESVKVLKEHIYGTKTMFGFAMAKDEESLAKVHQGHFKYIEGGKFMQEVFKNEESLSQAAWLFRNRETIINAVANKNLQKGKQAILDEIREPEVITPHRFKDPKGSDEFDPQAFTYG